HTGSCAKQRTSGLLPIYLCQKGRIIFLRNRPGRQLSSRRHLCGSHLARRQAGRTPGAVSKQVRDGPEPQDRQGAWPHSTPIDFASRRLGDRMKRREFIAGLGAAAVWPVAARAQRPAVPVVGFLNSESLEPRRAMLAAFHRGLAETGYVEGRNLAIEYRWAEGRNDRLPVLAAELVRRQVSVIATPNNSAATFAAKAATQTIPIVFGVGADPVAGGLVPSLNRPGGNLTGVSLLNVEVAAKRVELLHELVPTTTSIAFL